MKKTIFIALLAIFSLGTAPVFANSSAKATETATATNSKLTTDEVNALTKRVEEIRDMDKSEMTLSEKSELKSELKEIKETMKSSDPYVYIGGSSLIILIIVLIILL
jgi:peptidoglycan hydrolase CwlO-like protein